jgi:N-acetylmuramoyl-L-alanine amidase
MLLAQQVDQRLQADGCQVQTILTRQSAAQQFVQRSTRAATAENFKADMFVTLAFNALTGSPWGSKFDGGPVGWARPGKPNDDDLVGQLYGRMDFYTKRPPHRGVQHALLYPEFAGLSMSSYAHLEALFLDHNFDHPVITQGFSLITDAVYAAIRTRLEAQGMQCLVPNPNGPGYIVPPLPLPPNPDLIQRLRDLGFQNYQRYGADPVISI